MPEEGGRDEWGGFLLNCVVKMRFIDFSIPFPRRIRSNFPGHCGVLLYADQLRGGWLVLHRERPAGLGRWTCGASFQPE